MQREQISIENMEYRQDSRKESCYSILGGIVLLISTFLALSCSEYADS